MKKSNITIFLFLGSGALNIFFVIFLSYQYFFRDISSTIPVLETRRELKKQEHFSLQEYLHILRMKTYYELLFLLNNEEIVEDGYRIRDLALTMLAQRDHFDVEKALQRKKFSRRDFYLKQKNTQERYTLFPGLSQYDFHKIRHFAFTERWPLTSKGIFLLRQKLSNPSLEEAWKAKEEFQKLRNLFSHKGSCIDEEDLLVLTKQLCWETVDTFVYEQKQWQDLTKERRRHFLWAAVEEGATKAAELFIKEDLTYAVKQLSNEQLLMLLDLLPPSKDIDLLCRKILQSHRSDAVWKQAADKLCLFHKEPLIEPYDHQKALSKFISSTSLEKSCNAAVDSKSLGFYLFGEKKRVFPKIHEVQEGENLWKIARKYHLEVEAIIQHNQLKDDRIYPGMKIALPQEENQSPPGGKDGI